MFTISLEELYRDQLLHLKSGNARGVLITALDFVSRVQGAGWALRRALPS